MASRSIHRLLSLATAALTVTVLAGCGAALDDDADAADASVADRPERPKRAAQRTPAPTTPASPSPSGSADVESVDPDAPLSERLLTADEVPGFNDDFTWTEAGTGDQEPDALAGTCHRFPMLSVGAVEVAHRDYRAADGTSGSRANELVASFADTKSAWRAFEVLKSWRADCAQALTKWDQSNVGELKKVDVHSGEAHWYLLLYGPVDEHGDEFTFDAEGIALVGDRIAVVRMALVGQDYNYPTGDEPMVAAIRAAAAKLG